MGHEDLPEIALKLAERNDVFRKYISNLNSTIAWYNKMRRTTKDVEFNLIENEIAEIDELIIQGQNTLNWNSEGKHCFLSKPSLVFLIRLMGVHDKIVQPRWKFTTKFTKVSRESQSNKKRFNAICSPTSIREERRKEVCGFVY